MRGPSDGDQDGASHRQREDKMNQRQKPLLCRLGRHHWHTEHNDEGQAYLLCDRCGKDRDSFHLSDSATFF
jgi:hypothetical protein